MNATTSAVLRPARLAEVRRSGLLDTGPEEPFDRLTRLACELLDAPFGFVTVVDETRSFWKSCTGVAATTLAERQNPVDESFCQYVVAADDKVIIGDARLVPMTRDNPSIEKMGVVAWAGFPVRSPAGEVLGSFCVVDSRPREWSAQDLRTLEVLAHAAGGEVALRVAAEDAALAARMAEADADRYRQLAHTLQESLLPRELPVVEGLDVAAAYRLSGDEVNGDFLDAVQTPTGWAIFLGDVAGRGAHAARTSALASYTLRAGAVRATSPAIVLTEVDGALSRWFDETGVPGFAGVTYAAFRADDPGFGVRVTAAGHAPALIRRADGRVHPIGRVGSPLGILPKLSLQVDDAVLHPGDSMVLHSKALSDTAGEALIATTGPDARSMADALLARTAGADPRANAAVVVIRVPG